jgi:regulator of protease activity HflC (stomatin/prohibitin superfamily)
MAHVSIPPPPGPGGRISKGLVGIAGGLLVLVALFALYLVSPFFTVGEYERTVVTRFGQFSSVAGPGLHFRIPFVNGLEAFPIGIQRMQKDHLKTTRSSMRSSRSTTVSPRGMSGASTPPIGTTVRTLSLS